MPRRRRRAVLGFAAVNAVGRNGTTGGAGGPEVTVSTAADLIAAIKATGSRVVRVQGMITLPAGMHDVGSEKTTVGVGAASGVTGGGLNIVGGTVVDPRTYYGYALDTSANVKTLVTQGAGTGRT